MSSVCWKKELSVDLSAEEGEEDLSVGGVEKMRDLKKEPMEANLFCFLAEVFGDGNGGRWAGCSSINGGGKGKSVTNGKEKSAARA